MNSWIENEFKDRYMQIMASPPTESLAKFVRQIEGLEKNGATLTDIILLILKEQAKK